MKNINVILMVVLMLVSFSVSAAGGSKLMGSVTYYTTAPDGTPNRFVHTSGYNEDLPSMEVCTAFIDGILSSSPEIDTLDTFNDDGKPSKDKVVEYSLVRVSTLKCLSVSVE